MTHMVRRRFQGGSNVDPVEMDRIVANELVPQLKALPGFVRYVTASYDDGTLGSTTQMDSEESAKRSDELGRKWASGASAMQNMKLVDSIVGKVIARVELSNSDAPGFLMHRLYRTDASEQEAQRVFEQVLPEYGRRATGLVRGSVLFIPDGRIMTLGWFDTAAHAAASTQAAQSLTTPGSDIAKLLSYGAEQIVTGRMISVHM